jgi:Tol biopolymer transport system component
MINIASGSLSRLTYNDTFDSFPVFSKNGKKIVFSSNRDAENPRNTNIFIADIVDK